MNHTLLQRTAERIENSDSQGNTSTEDLVVINTLAASLDATEMARLIRIPQARSFFDESSSDDISERLLRTFTQDVQVIDETLEALLENTFSEEREEGASFLADLTAHSWKIQVQSTTMDDDNMSSVLNAYSFNDHHCSPKTKLPARGTFDSLREEVYFEQPITLLTLDESDLFLYHIMLDQDEKISFCGIKLTAACVLPDGQIVATGDNCCAYTFQANSGWQRIGDLIYNRNDHAIVFHRGTVYIVGGIKEVERLGSNNSWEEITPLNNARRFPAAVSMQGKLYVVGGIKDISNFAAIEILNDMIWEILDIKLPNHLHGHACFFTPEHKLVILSSTGIITIEEGQNTAKISQLNCQDMFLLNSWSYLEEENKVVVWGQKMIWKYNIVDGVLEAFKKWISDST